MRKTLTFTPMVKRFLTFVLILLAASVAMGQYSTVIYNYELNRFGENEPLPSERNILFTGNIPSFIDVVEISIYNHKGLESRGPLAAGVWKRTFNDEGTAFSIPMNYPLQASKKYDVAITFFSAVSDEQKAELYQQLLANLHAYLDQTTQVSRSGFKLIRKSKQLVADLNTIVWTGLQNYRSKTNLSFNGFSDLVAQSIDNLDNTKLPASMQSLPDSLKEAKKAAMKAHALQQVKTQVDSELRFLLNQDWAMLYDQRYIDDYPTEDRPTHFAINAGYGGIWLNGKLDDKSSFGDAAYFGLGFPLSTSTIAPRFLQDASLTVGFFTRNFNGDDGTTYSGPIFNRPLYAGIDYKLFSFIRLNGGAAIIEKTPANGSGNSIVLKPFLGISAKVNISLSLDK